MKKIGVTSTNLKNLITTCEKWGLDVDSPWKGKNQMNSQRRRILQNPHQSRYQCFSFPCRKDHNFLWGWHKEIERCRQRREKREHDGWLHNLLMISLLAPKIPLPKSLAALIFANKKRGSAVTSELWRYKYRITSTTPN